MRQAHSRTPTVHMHMYAHDELSDRLGKIDTDDGWPDPERLCLREDVCFLCAPKSLFGVDLVTADHAPHPSHLLLVLIR